MTVLLAPDKFKGSLTAVQVIEHLTAGLRAVAPHAETVAAPIADGGDGTVDAAVGAGFRRVRVRASGPLGDPVDTSYAELDGVAVVELADACGLVRLPGGRLAPLSASSTGLGEVVRAALDAGARRLVLAVGGSASTDGGAGMLSALGARFLDADGAQLRPGGAALSALDRVDVSGLHPRLHEVEVLLASDVDNPLLGERGAAAVYGPQKGAAPSEVAVLESALARLSTVLSAVDGGIRTGSATAPADAATAPAATGGAHPPSHPVAGTPGAGAAGGVGFAALAVLGARARPGIELLLELTGFLSRLPTATLVVTGEGSLDEQTLHGKAPAGVAAAARAQHVPVVAVAGRSLLGLEQLAEAGFAGLYTLSELEPDPRTCMTEAGPLLEQVGRRLAADWLVPRRAEARADPSRSVST